MMGISKSRICRNRIGKELNTSPFIVYIRGKGRTISRQDRRTRLDETNAKCTRTRIDREAGSRAEDARCSPSTDYRIQPGRHVTADLAATAKWKVPNKVRVEEMPDIEI